MMQREVAILNGMRNLYSESNTPAQVTNTSSILKSWTEMFSLQMILLARPCKSLFALHHSSLIMNSRVGLFVIVWVLRVYSSQDLRFKSYQVLIIPVLDQSIHSFSLRFKWVSAVIGPLGLTLLYSKI